MEGQEEPNTGKYREIKNDWNYDSQCIVTSLVVWKFENFRFLPRKEARTHSIIKSYCLTTKLLGSI
jgi:hypothetical protein